MTICQGLWSEIDMVAVGGLHVQHRNRSTRAYVYADCVQEHEPDREAVLLCLCTR